MEIAETVRTFVNQIFEKEPDATCLITNGNDIVAVLDKEQWERRGPFEIALRGELSMYRAPTLFLRGDIPEVGVIAKIDLSECERWELVDGE